MDKKELDRITTEITKKLLDKGLIIEAGFEGFRLAVYEGRELPASQFDEVRNAFFAGALHLLSSIMPGMDDGTEETEADLRRMDNIHNELQRFEQELRIKHGFT